MLESVVKGNVYNIDTFTMIDKKTGKEQGMIHISYIFKGREDTPTKYGYESGQTYFIFNDELFKKLKEYLLKSVDLTFKLVPEYKDSTKYTSKLVAINDFIIKQD